MAINCCVFNPLASEIKQQFQMSRSLARLLSVCIPSSVCNIRMTVVIRHQMRIDLGILLQAYARCSSIIGYASAYLSVSLPTL